MYKMYIRDKDDYDELNKSDPSPVPAEDDPDISLSITFLENFDVHVKLHVLSMVSSTHLE
jgi:hypothetical protein